MFLTNKTVITFDPVRESDVMNKFMEDNDMTEWKEYPSTVGITFVREIRLSLGYERGEEPMRLIDADELITAFPCGETVRTECVRATIGHMPTIEERKTDRWIPCSERLPEKEHKEYWVCTDTEYQCQCRWTDVNHFWTSLTTDWHWHLMDVPQYTKVVAWRELPEPWRGEEHENQSERISKG